jgi:hypothetical protein
MACSYASSAPALRKWSSATQLAQAGAIAILDAVDVPGKPA